MRTLVLDPLPELQELLARRKRLGQDGYDEVWEGVYHVAPMARSAHGWLQGQLLEVFGPRARAAGLTALGPFNLGDGKHNFRVPDLGVVRVLEPRRLYLTTAAVVVEVVSPRDETYEKFGFYAAHEVDEIVVVDPDARSVRIFLRDGADYAQAPASALLGVVAADLAHTLNWG